MAYVRAAVFFAATGAHFLLIPFWLNRARGNSYPTREEFGFQSIVLGLGLLQAVLHGLACTVGISLPAGVAALVTLHLFIMTAVMRRPSPSSHPSTAEQNPANEARAARSNQRGRRAAAQHLGTRSSPAAPHLSWASIAQVNVLTLVGTIGIAACVLSWLVRSVGSMQITGIDANQYHVPYAVNFAHGAGPFGYLVLGSDHCGPVGASILNAWFYQAFSDPLCFDLVNLLPFLLLFLSLAYLFTLLTDAPGFEWVPVIFLLLFTGRLFRIGLFVSADLYYGATFAAAFTQLCAIWMRNKADTYDWLVLSLSMGMLLGSKTHSPVSAALLVGFVGVAMAIRTFVWPKQAPQFTNSVGTAVLCTILLIAAGGVWPIRNWLYFGSPMAPVGLHLFGLTIFRGVASSGAPADSLPSAGFLPDSVGTLFPSSFLAHSIESMGPWIAYLSLGGVVLLIDSAYQLAKDRHLTGTMRRKLSALLLFVALFIVHSALLVHSRGESVFDVHYGQLVRYLIPLYALYPVVVYAGFFTETLPWLKSPAVRWLVILPALIYVVARYNHLTELSPDWIRAHGSEDLVDYRLVPLAAVLVAPWCIPLRGVWRGYARYISVAVLTVSLFAFVWFAVEQDTALLELISNFQHQDRLAFERTGNVPNPYTGVLLRAQDDQRRHSTMCQQSRFFAMSLFLYPLAVQDPRYSNFVYLLPTDAAWWAQRLPSNRPGAGPCDYIIAAYKDVTEFRQHYTPVDPAAIKPWIPSEMKLEDIGDSGRYRVYHVIRE